MKLVLLTLAAMAVIISALNGREWRAWRKGRAAFLQGQADRDAAVRELLFLSAVEGMQKLSRGGKGCVFRAVEALRPDIAEHWASEGGDGMSTLRQFFPADDRDGEGGA